MSLKHLGHGQTPRGASQMSAAFSPLPLSKLCPGPRARPPPAVLCFEQSLSGQLFEPRTSPFSTGAALCPGNSSGSASALAFPAPPSDPANYGLSLP